MNDVCRFLDSGEKAWCLVISTPRLVVMIIRPYMLFIWIIIFVYVRIEDREIKSNRFFLRFYFSRWNFLFKKKNYIGLNIDAWTLNKWLKNDWTTVVAEITELRDVAGVPILVGFCKLSSARTSDDELIRKLFALLAYFDSFFNSQKKGLIA